MPADRFHEIGQRNMDEASVNTRNVQSCDGPYEKFLRLRLLIVRIVLYDADNAPLCTSLKGVLMTAQEFY